MFYFDTYALIEILQSNPAYCAYDNVISVVISQLNLMELYYWALRERGQETADRYYDYLERLCRPFTSEDIKLACKFRFQHRGKGISYIDALGYAMARRLCIKFLTGDNAFKGLPNVEFVR